MDSEPSFEEIDAGDTIWRFDRSFLTSNWTCIWDRGCHGIDTVKAAERGHGCCSVGAEIDGIDEAMTLSASIAALSPENFQHHREAVTNGVFSDERHVNTRVVDGACIFLNRPGFDGGAGCALHIAAVAAGESPLDWKPSVCWQVPVRVDWEMRSNDVEVATVRRWTRDDWGDDGEAMAWCCTERHADGGTGEAFIGDTPVIESLAEELEAIVGSTVFVQLRRRLADGR